MLKHWALSVCVRWIHRFYSEAKNGIFSERMLKGFFSLYRMGGLPSQDGGEFRNSNSLSPSGTAFRLKCDGNEPRNWDIPSPDKQKSLNRYAEENVPSTNFVDYYNFTERLLTVTGLQKRKEQKLCAMLYCWLSWCMSVTYMYVYQMFLLLISFLHYWWITIPYRN